MQNSRYILPFLIAILTGYLVGCSGARSEALRPAYSVFAITPDIITLNQKFHIVLPEQHPSKMSIRDPRGIWHWVQDAEEKITFMPEAEFRKATRIMIDPGTLQGVSWINGRKIRGRVFKYPGEYLVYFANNLETEPDNTFHFMAKITVAGQVDR